MITFYLNHFFVLSSSLCIVHRIVNSVNSSTIKLTKHDATELQIERWKRGKQHKYRGKRWEDVKKAWGSGRFFNLLYIHSDGLWLQKQSISPIRKNNERGTNISHPVKATLEKMHYIHFPTVRGVGQKRGMSLQRLYIQPVCMSCIELADYFKN